MARAGRKSGASSSGGSAGGGGFALTVAAVGRGRGEPTQILFDSYVARLPWPLRLVEIRETREAAAGLKAAEGKKLAGQIGRSLRGQLNLFHAASHRVLFIEFRQRESRITHDGGEQVIKIMCHAACQRTYGLHFLGLDKLLA